MVDAQRERVCAVGTDDARLPQPERHTSIIAHHDASRFTKSAAAIG
jgi:hypothetical protein